MNKIVIGQPGTYIGKNIVKAEHFGESFRRKYDKVALVSEIWNGKEVIIVSDGEEYKSLCENLCIENK